MILELLHDTPYEGVFARGMQIIEKDRITQIGCAKDPLWKVHSQTRDVWHHVRTTKSGWSCACKAHTQHHKICSHIAASFMLGMSMERAPPTGYEMPDLPERWCRFCGSVESSHVECRRLKRMAPCEGNDTYSRYECHKCGRKFVDRPGFEGLHYPEKVILSALGRVAEGSSPAGAARGINTDMGIKVSGRSVQRWVKRFSSLIYAFTGNLKLPHGVGAMSIDEKHFKSNGGAMYLFEIMSVRSRYIICYDTARDKLNYDATRLLQTAVARAGMPLAFVSDKLKGFKKAHRSVTCTGLKPQTLHFADAGIGKVHVNNNQHERHNGETAARIKNTRGFGSETPPLIVLSIVHHNFLRPHMGLNGKTPAEVEGIIIPGHNKLRTLIRCAKFTSTKFT